MDGNIMVAGAPRFGNGIVQAFSRSASTGTWSTLNTVFPGQEADDFGAAVDVSVGSSRVAMVVGAPRSLDTQGFEQPFGAAFYYELNGDAWSQRGGRVAPNPSIFSANGEAGAAVAVAADSRRIAVGGPSISLNSQNIDNVSFVLDNAWISVLLVWILNPRFSCTGPSLYIPIRWKFAELTCHPRWTSS